MIELLFAMAFWPWFWLLLMMGGLTLAAAYENLGAAVMVTVIYMMMVVGAIYQLNPFAWLVYHPVAFLSCLLLYLLIGIAWSLFKWRNHMKSEPVQRALAEAKRQFTEMEDSDEFKSSYYFPAYASPQNQQERILSWIALWPFSALLYACGDMMVTMGKALFGQLRGAYDGITERYLL